MFDHGFAGEDGGRAELFLDADELVVFVHAFAAGNGAGFDLASVHGHGEVGDEGVSGFAAAVADHAGPAGFVGGVYSVNGLHHGADLVEFDEHAVGGFFGYSALDDGGVGNVEVVAHELDFVAEGGG